MHAIIYGCSQCGDRIKVIIGYIPFDIDMPCPKCGKLSRIHIKEHVM